MGFNEQQTQICKRFKEKRINEMKMIKKLSVIIIAVVFSFSLSGCWNYREIENLIIASGYAVDWDYKTNKYILTVEAIDTNKVKGGQSTSSDLYSAEGDTIFDATRNLVSMLGQKIFWSHAKVIIISKYIAEKSINPILDFCNRDSEPRNDMWILISNDVSARSVLRAKSNINSIVSFQIDNIMKTQQISGRFPRENLWKIGLEHQKSGYYTALPETRIEQGYYGLTVKVGGSAIFHDEKMISEINENETFYMLLMEGEVKKGVIKLMNFKNDGNNFSIEVFDSLIKKEPAYDNGKLVMNITTKIVGAIDEVDKESNILDKVEIEKIQNEAAQLVKNNEIRIIKKAQFQIGGDIFGFGDVIERKLPWYWKQNSKNASDVFKNMQMNLKVQVRIKGTGTLSKPIKGGD